jgi:hypothetical protein
VFEYFTLRDCGFAEDEIKLHRYAPIGIWVEDGGDAEMVLKTLGDLFDGIEFDLVHAFGLQISSIGINSFARSRNKYSSKEHEKNLEAIHKTLKDISEATKTGIDLEARRLEIEKTKVEAEAFAIRLGAISDFMKSLPRGVAITIGFIMISTFDPTGHPTVEKIGRSAIESILNDPSVLRDPLSIIENTQKSDTLKKDVGTGAKRATAGETKKQAKQ